MDVEESKEKKVCRICLQDEEEDCPKTPENAFVSPCNCKGTSKNVHVHCLQSWLESKQQQKQLPNTQQQRLASLTMNIYNNYPVASNFPQMPFGAWQTELPLNHFISHLQWSNRLMINTLSRLRTLGGLDIDFPIPNLLQQQTHQPRTPNATSTNVNTNPDTSSANIYPAATATGTGMGDTANPYITNELERLINNSSAVMEQLSHPSLAQPWSNLSSTGNSNATNLHNATLSDTNPFTLNCNLPQANHLTANVTNGNNANPLPRQNPTPASDIQPPTSDPRTTQRNVENHNYNNFCCDVCKEILPFSIKLNNNYEVESVKIPRPENTPYLVLERLSQGKEPKVISVIKGDGQHEVRMVTPKAYYLSLNYDLREEDTSVTSSSRTSLCQDYTLW